MLWLVFVVVAILSYLVLFVLPKRWAFLSKTEKFDGPKGWPLIGSALDLNVDRSEVLKVLSRWIETYGRSFRFFVGLQPYVMVASAKDMERILSSGTEIEKSYDYELLYPWLGLGLLTSKGEKWFHRRKQLTPAFHFKILEDFLKVFNEQCSTLQKVLEAKGTQAFDIFPVITHCALDIICETAMGKRIDAQQKSDSDYVKAIYRMSELVQYRQLRPWLLPDFTWNLTSEGREQKRCLQILHSFTDKVIGERKEERRKGKNEATKSEAKTEDDIYMGSGKKRLAFLDLLLDAQETDSSLNDKNVREETDTFMFEGHDTTSAAVSWTTFFLACNPPMQKKVHEELDSIFESDRSREVTMADLTQMKYLECCIKEGLRLVPSVPFVGRILKNDLELGEKGVKAPASSTLFISFYHLHKDEKVFPNPEQFEPARFLNNEARHPYSYLPFSAGSRNCVGQKFAIMEEKVMLATIFRNFNVTSVKSREEVEVLCELICRPEGGHHLILEKR